MNSLRETGYIICVVLVITGIFLMLLPSGNTVKSVRLAIHLFLIISIVAPIFNVRTDFSKFSYDYELNENKAYNNLTELYNKEIIESFKRELLITAKSVFEKYDIVPEKIEIMTNVNDNQSIDITSVNITLNNSDKNKSEKAISEINSFFSVDCVVTFVEGE